MKKGQSGNPGEPPQQKEAAGIARRCAERTVFVTIDAEHRQITKRKAIVHQLVNKSTTADLRATKMLFDMMKKAEQKAGVAEPEPEPPPFTAADEEVVEHLIERISIKSSPDRDGRQEAPKRRRDRRALMTDDELVEELHELKRRNQTPIPLNECSMRWLSPPQAGRKPAAHEILRDRGCAARTDRQSTG